MLFSMFGNGNKKVEEDRNFNTIIEGYVVNTNLKGYSGQTYHRLVMLEEIPEDISVLMEARYSNVLDNFYLIAGKTKDFCSVEDVFLPSGRVLKLNEGLYGYKGIFRPSSPFTASFFPTSLIFRDGRIFVNLKIGFNEYKEKLVADIKNFGDIFTSKDAERNYFHAISK